MNTYRYRLKFHTHAKGVITHTEKRYLFNLPDGIEIQLSCLDSDSISNSRELVLSSGGYPTEKKAFQLGSAMKNALLLTGAKFRIGIDAGKDKANCGLNPAIKKNFLNTHGIKIIEDIHGISVYSEEHPVKVFSTSGIELISPSNVDTFGSDLCNSFVASQLLTKKQKLALELYGASHFEKSDRARFLTLVLGIEALLDPEDKNNNIKEVIDRLLCYVKESDLKENEKQSILGSLSWLYKDSISQSLRKMAQEYLADKFYNGLTPVKFINKCYEVRSKLVHTGESDNENVGVLAANLNVYLSDLIQALIIKSSPPKKTHNHSKLAQK